ncbi:MAG TPA: hypothetical protein VFJ48_00780, partial [Casimicrobiaceae bacterium]|nr:hypothetical protein [Casimicrobiaceae bacterium]
MSMVRTLAVAAIGTLVCGCAPQAAVVQPAEPPAAPLVATPPPAAPPSTAVEPPRVEQAQPA